MILMRFYGIKLMEEKISIRHKASQQLLFSRDCPYSISEVGSIQNIINNGISEHSIIIKLSRNLHDIYTTQRRSRIRL